MKLLRALGIDRAVAFAFMARLAGIAGSTGTVLLIARFLSPVEQGYYYTLLSLVALQPAFTGKLQRFADTPGVGSRMEEARRTVVV